MREKIFIFLGLIFLITLLIGLNAANYVQREKIPDTEIAPNRSTYNAGATGTRALYELLAETGSPVVRWPEPPAALLSAGETATPQTFVVIGPLRREFTQTETEHLLEWVSRGGKLVVIDRRPPSGLLAATGGSWGVSLTASDTTPELETDPADPNQMTAGEFAANPAQPTVYTRAVNAVRHSRFASSVSIIRRAALEENETAEPAPTTDPPSPISGSGPAGAPADADTESADIPAESPPPPAVGGEEESPINLPEGEIQTGSRLAAPVIHLANDKKNILAELPYGAGRIIFLTDPYITANGGISQADNVQLALNLLRADGSGGGGGAAGVIAFDEYHQGFGSGANRIFDYFAGTPVAALFLQVIALILLLLVAQSRRFARPLPAPEPDRLAKLEYVSAMAQLQQRTRAYDLAIENVYRDFRRRVSRLVGVDNHTTGREKLARLIAERSSQSAAEIEDLMFKCEDIIHGEPTGKREVVRLIGRLRRLENELGLERKR